MSATEIDALLADFRSWLEASGTMPAVEPVGLDTLAAEFTALRHDVQLHTKAARAAVEKLSSPATPPDPREVQRPLVLALADIADALRTARDGLRLTDGEVPTLGEYRKPGRLERWLFGPAPTTDLLAVTTVTHLVRRLAAVADGYELSLKRVERALAAVGLEAIPAVGERFDPQTMEAVALDDGDDRPTGTVLAESRRGYRWHGEVFRFARVTVAR